jgi:hypothetical protein
MSLFSAFQSLWSYCADASALDDSSATCGPMGTGVNIDGTPMLNETMDIHGHPFGVTDSPFVDLFMSLDGCSIDCGSSSFGGDFGCGLE